VTGLDKLLGLQEVEAPFQTIATGRWQHLPQRNIPGTHFLLEARRITSMKNPNHPSGNQNPDIPGCCAMPQPITPLPTPHCYRNNTNLDIAEYFAKQLVIAPVSICVSKRIRSPINGT